MTDHEHPAGESQEDIAKRALEAKQGSDAPHHPQPGQTADEGMSATPNAKIAASGALHAEGQRPVLERSRKVR